MGSIMKWNLFAPPKFGFIHVLPIFLQDSSCGALVIEPLARSPSLNLLQKLEKRLGHERALVQLRQRRITAARIGSI